MNRNLQPAERLFGRVNLSTKQLLTTILFSGILASVLFSSFIYPRIAGQIENRIVTDGYDRLAQGVIAFGTLSYYPQSEPTVRRAPLYPLLLAGCMVLAGEHFAIPGLALQAFLHGATAVMAALLALSMGSRRAAAIAGLLCALHPVLLWYSGRFVIETLSAFLFTVTVFLAVQYWKRPSTSGAVAVGVTIGIALWCKAAYLPLLIMIPILIVLARRDRLGWQQAGVVACAGLVVIAPWIIRNYLLTDRWPIFQALVGYNLYVSDSFVENAAESPLGYAKLVEKIDFEGMQAGTPSADHLHSASWREANEDELLQTRSVHRYLHEPIFLLKKVVLNAIWIWTLASTWSVSLVMALFQWPLLFLTVLSTNRILRLGGWRSPKLLAVWIAAAYVASHLPIYALARFSIVLIPSLTSVVVSTGIRLSHRAYSGVQGL